MWICSRYKTYLNLTIPTNLHIYQCHSCIAVQKTLSHQIYYNQIIISHELSLLDLKAWVINNLGRSVNAVPVLSVFAKPVCIIWFIAFRACSNTNTIRSLRNGLAREAASVGLVEHKLSIKYLFLNNGWMRSTKWFSFR